MTRWDVARPNGAEVRENGVSRDASREPRP